ncbi:RING-H2 finger protein ATL57-like [Amaranthus tricolor]|uniref:RING-H2 finger protein ATL57-like n=1 Tax=Amaranthus tricolor TaxID=29722 RepID=UPI0025877284|nr:RING-H2 finger protein ATL57-like [Amaranthus tricolor]
MTTHYRKLLLPLQDHNPTIFSSKNNYPSSNSQETENPANYSSSSSSCCYNNLKLNPPFDSAMALTVLVLLTALFFMGFFSIYIRRFADESSVDPNRRRRSSDSAPTVTTSYLSSLKGSSKGVDPSVVNSLPVHAYFPGDAKQGIIDETECAICLSEFEEKEWVKEIPYCGHVFHVGCIDTWLASHVTCPLCRTAKLLMVEEEEKVEVVVEGQVAEGGERGLGVGEVQGDDVETRGEMRLVVDGGDTWNEEGRVVGATSERRSSSSSCVWFGERVSLHRSFSF